MASGLMRGFRLLAVAGVVCGLVAVAPPPFSAVGASACAPVPGAPEGVAVDAGDGFLSVRWTAPADDESATAFEVQYKQAAASEWVVAAERATGTGLRISGLVNEVRYAVRVRSLAYAVPGPGDCPSRWVEASGVPGLLAAAEVSLMHRVHLGFQVYARTLYGAERVRSYEFQYRESAGEGQGWGAWKDAPHSGSATAVVVGLTAGRAYQTRVRAINGIGAGAWSVPAGDPVARDYAGAGLPDPPLQPTVAAGDSRLTVAWDAPAANNPVAVAGYQVVWEWGSGPGTMKGNSGAVPLPASAASYEVAGLENGTEYRVWVRSLGAEHPCNPQEETPPCHSYTGSPQQAATPRPDPVPVLGSGFAAGGRWLLPGTVSLDWDDVAAASGYDLRWRSPDGWALLSESDPADGIAAELDGSSGLVGSLPKHLESYWFSVRARNARGESQWSDGFQVVVPPTAVEPVDAEPLFDPFTAPTRSNIDLERLGEAAATITPGQADCTAVPALNVAGVTFTDPPASLADPDAELTVAEVVRIAGGCLLIEYAALGGRTTAQIRELLASDPTVFAVDEPARGFAPDHPDEPADPADPTPEPVPHPAHSKAHHDDGGGEQWHLSPDVFDLWDLWVDDSPVTVAVLDTGVDVRHPDLSGQIATNSPGGCHKTDGSGHGTHVAGIVAAEEGNGQYTAGVAPDARILPVSVALRGNDCTNTSPALAPLTPPAAVAEAVNRGAQVINMSFSGSALHNVSGIEVGGVAIESEDAYETVLRTASMLGVVSVASAGNCGDDRVGTDGTPNWKKNKCPRHNAARLPAVFSRVLVDTVGTEPVFGDGDVIAVAAVDKDGTHRESSTANQYVDIAAPGGEILSTVRCTGTRSPNSPPPTCGTDEKSGTSMAAPFVSGVVAHMLNRYPQALPGQVRAALQMTAEDEGDAGKDDEFGHGIVQPKAAIDELGEKIEKQRVSRVVGGFKSVAAAGRFSCGVLGNGAARCWGDEGVARNTLGVVFSSVSVPVGWVAAGTSDYGCGLRPTSLGANEGRVVCWTGTPGGVLRVAPQGAFTQIAAGWIRTCGLRPAGSVVCWHNQTGQRVSGVPSGVFKQVSGGWDHWCGLRENRTVACWGNNAHGQSNAPAGQFSDVDAGRHFSCGVTFAGGNIVCWGRGSAVTGAPGSGGFLDVDAGFGHACAISPLGASGINNAGTATCWGDNAHGQATAPRGIYTQVSAGWRHSCGIVRDVKFQRGEAVCWGDDSWGQGSTPDLVSLSLEGPAGVDLLAPAFKPGVVAYKAESPRQVVTLGWEATVADVVSVSPADADSAMPGHQVLLADGVAIEVSVTSLFGNGEKRVYRVTVVELPRLGSLRVYGPGYGRDCLVDGGCVGVSLDPVFDPETADYEVTAPASWGQVTVVHTATGGTAVVRPADAVAGTLGHQVALATDTSFVQVAAGDYLSCGVKAGGAAACWGDNDFGQSDAPAGSFSAVSAGGGHACGLKTGGTVVCWGFNIWGQADSPATRFLFSGVSAGGSHTCAVKTDGVVWCWGLNLYGQSDPPMAQFTSVSAGRTHSCGIKTDKTAVCWGSNADSRSNAPSGLFAQVSAGTSHSCGVKADKTAVCWGNNDYGQSNAPAGAFAQVSAGWRHTCGIKTDKAIVCWGDNSRAQTNAPAGRFASVSAGVSHTCAAKTDKTAVCWGSNDGRADAPAGRFASVSAANSHTCGVKDNRADKAVVCWGLNSNKKADAPAGQFSKVSAGNSHTCAIKIDKTIACWGADWSGQAGAPSGMFSAVSAGGSHTCAIKADKTAVCWGSNSSGRSDAPSGMFSAVSAGSSHTCGVKADKTVVCWGSNSSGKSDAPAGQFTAVSAGNSHTCAVNTNKAVVCWGDNNHGQVGAPAGQFTAVSAGRSHTCAVNTNKAVVCWGDNNHGQVDAPAGQFTAVSAGRSHTCAVNTTKAIVCWGIRYRELEPAEQAHITITVHGKTAAAVAGSGTTTTPPAVYTIRIDRPRPTPPPTARAASNRQASASGAAVGAASANPDAPTAEGQQSQHDQPKDRENPPPSPRGNVPPPQTYPLPRSPAVPGFEGGEQTAE